MRAKHPVDIVALVNAQVYPMTGKPFRLGTIWQKQKTMLIFLRHFACIACRAHAVQVWQDRAKYQKAGVQLVFIGNGLPQYIEGFIQELGLEGATILTDPSLLSYRAVGFKKGFAAVVQPRSAINAVKLALAGHSQKMPSEAAGTNWQLGGAVLVSTDGKILYHYISEALGDFPPESDTPQMLQTATGTSLESPAIPKDEA